MFLYFGYGSNINLVSLKAKGVMPLRSCRALLKGWELTFNVKHWFRHEGGMGNIRPREGHLVEGVMHQCQDEHLAILDAVEAYGIGYDRIEVEVESQGKRFKALAYVGLPEYLDDNCKPTERYMNIMIKGAREAALSESYIYNLNSQSLFDPGDYPLFVPPHGDVSEFTSQTLASFPTCTALAGYVFEMANARRELRCLHQLFGGKDMTLFHLKRHDSSDRSRCTKDVTLGKISDSEKKYINAYLQEYNREFNYCGIYRVI